VVRQALPVAGYRIDTHVDQRRHVLEVIGVARVHRQIIRESGGCDEPLGGLGDTKIATA
jgi:hypothetical protein